MEIYINNQLATIKQGTSFEYIAENRLFSGSDDYTLSITFPLKDCAQNLAIFGNIHRKDVENSKVRFDCEIRDRNFHKYGTVTVTEISESEVKTQFLEGRSEQNFDDTFDDIYINELDLGEPSVLDPSKVTPTECWNTSGSSTVEAVALPWVNNSSGNIQNKVDNAKGVYSWNEDCTALSWQPYLIFIAKQICRAVGYTYDFKAWQESELRFLLCCNTLPAAWEVPGYARALPHWTVAEFFEKLELLMGCEFDIDHRQQRITFAFSRTVLDALAPIEIESVVDSYSCEVTADSSDNSCDYIGAKNLVFKECSHEMWKYYSCDWLIDSFRNNNLIREYNTLKELIAALYDFSCYEKVTLRNTEAYYIHHAKDVDMYFCIKILRKESEYDTDKKKMRWYYYCALQPINQFGGHIVSDDDDATETEVEFVPAWIDDTDSTYGKCLFLDPASYDEETGEEDDDTTTVAQPYPVATLIAGEKDRSSEYYSVIYVAWWDGNLPMLGKMPFPAIDAVEIINWKYATHDFSLRINRSFNSDETNLYKYNIEPTHKYTFKFLANEIPNARALFIIEGKRYLAEKITATFTESGMSQLIKGTFYRVI